MKARPALRRLFDTLGICLLISPAFVLLGALLTPKSPALWLLPGAAAALLAFAARAIPRKYRVPAVIFALPCCAGLALLPGYRAGQLLLSAAPAALAAAVLLWHLKALCLPAGEAYTATAWYAGMGVHLLARLLLLSPKFAAAKGALVLLCPAYFAYAFFALNETTVTAGMGGGRGPSAAMRLRNRLLTGALCASMLILANLPALIGWLRAFIDLCKRGLAALLAYLSSAPPDEVIPEQPQMPGADMFAGLAGEVAPPSAFSLFMEKALRYIVIAAACALALAALWFLGKKLLRLIRFLIARVRAYAGRINDAYEDTVESLLDWGEVRQAFKARADRAKRRRQERVPWDKLDNRQRVRRVYQLLRRKKSQAPDSRTARSLLTRGDMGVPAQAAGQMADIYDRARYSGADITPQEAQFMRDNGT